MRALAALLLAASVIACRSSAPPVPRYIVTATPIDILGTGHPGFCVAVDPTDAQGVWWWEPGRSGCSSRSTGPTVFRADRATVAAAKPSGEIEVHFQIALQVSPPRDVNLVIQDATLRVGASGARVATERRNDLEVPPDV